MAVKIYNTLSGEKEVLKPIKDKKVGLYTCGPTVYNYAHLGNLRTFIFEDILRRVLEYNGYDVTQVMNITDVGHLTSDADTGEDKIEKAARREKKNVLEIVDFYTAQFREDIAILNIQRPHMMPRATEHIREQIELVSLLEKKGFTYRTNDGIYFDTSKFKNYGKLGRIDIRGLKEGARIKKKDEKKNPTDFALWKFSPPGGGKKRQMEWDSPWGIGFPGWHIECSAMSSKYLGQPFDIHTGGIDHIPVHHQNEIAQSEGAYDKPLANYWVHGEFLVVDKKKMAKSAGKFFTLRDIEKKGYSPLAYRFLVLNAHYRTPLHFSWQAMETAKNGLEHLYNQIKELGIRTKDAGEINREYKNKFIEKINDDLNIPQALVVVHEVIKSKLNGKEKIATVLDFDKVLGLKLADALKPIEIPTEIKELAERRKKARRLHNWTDSDALRKEIRRLGFDIEDTPDGYLLKKR